MKKSIGIILSIILILGLTLPSAALASVAVKSIALDKSAITLKPGETVTLKITFTPQNTTQRLLTFVNDNKNVATIDTTGKIRAVAKGTTTITVLTANKQVFAKCKVTVLQPNAPVTLSIYGAINFASTYTSGIQDDPVAKSIEKKLNIKMDWEMQPSPDKFQALMASGSLPDIIVAEARFQETLVKANSVVDLEPLLQTNGPDINKNVPKMLGFVKKYQSYGTNKLHFLNLKINAPTSMPQMAPTGPYFRWDYYKELGAPAIKSDREWVDMIATILKKHPMNEDGKKYVGLTFWLDWGFPSLFQWGALEKGTAPLGSADTLSYNIFADKPVFIDSVMDDRSEIWLSMDFWNYAYRKGILDPESFTQKYDNAIQKGSSNQAIASWASWVLRDSNKKLDAKGLTGKGYNDNVTPFYIEGHNNVWYTTAPYGDPNYSYAITKNCKTPGRAMDLLNYFYSITGAMEMGNGAENEEWVKAGNSFKWTDAHWEHIKDPSAGQKYAIGKWGNQAGFFYDAADPSTGIALGVNKSDKIANFDKRETVVKDILKYYGAESPRQYVDKVFKPKTRPDVNALAASLMNPTVPDDIKLADSKIADYWSREGVKLIKAGTEAEFKTLKLKIRADLKNMDLVKVQNYYRNELTAAFAKAKEVK